MIGPGLLLTATHVLEEFPRSGAPPLFITFLPEGARAWLATDVIASSGPSAIAEDRKIKSDLTLVGCTLNSDAYANYPLTLAPLQISLPLIGERLWAFGFRHTDASGAAGVTPLVASGLVTAAFPHGRGERMPAPCVEVAMDTWGGMSGGPVANSDGYVIGIVSSSFDGGPSYVTLIWDVLRNSVKSTWPALSHRANGQINLLSGSALGVVKLKGNVKRFRRGDLVIRMTNAESQLMLSSADPSLIEQTDAVLDDDQLETFEDEHSHEMEQNVARVAINHLENITIASLRDFLKASDIPEACLAPISAFTVEDFEGVEDFEVISNKRGEDEEIAFLCAFDLLSVFWTIEVPTAVYKSNVAEFQQHFLNIEIAPAVTTMQVIQRCYFEAELVFHQKQEEFADASIKLTAVHRRRSR